MRRLLLAVAATLLLGASDDGPFTMGLAQSLSPEALERRVLQAPQGTTREVAVNDLRTRNFNFYWAAFEIVFAGAPAATKYPGLCVAEAQVATFGPGSRDFSSDTPVRLRQLSDSRRFAISEPDLTSGHGPSIEACLALGPVLARWGQPNQYFAAYGNGGRELGVRDMATAIQSIQRLVAPRGAPRVRCQEDVFAQYYKDLKPLCKDSAETMHSLNWKSLSFLSSTGCGEDRTCIMAVFDRPNTASTTMKVHIELSLNGAETVNGEVTNPGKIGSASITGVTHVD